MPAKNRLVILSPQSVKDLKSIAEFWLNRNQTSTYSEFLVTSFYLAVENLAIHPNVGKIVGEDKYIRAKLIAENYWIIYKIYERSVRILRLWDTRRKPGLILKYSK